jgi:hypothetical protein
MSDSDNKKSLILKLKDVSKELAYTTSMHGLSGNFKFEFLKLFLIIKLKFIKGIVSNTNWFYRIYWIIIVLAGVATSIYCIIYLFN